MKCFCISTRDFPQVQHLEPVVSTQNHGGWGGRGGGRVIVRCYNAMTNKTESAQPTLEMGIDFFLACYSLSRYSLDNSFAELCLLPSLNPCQSCQTNGEVCPRTRQVWLQCSPEQVLGLPHVSCSFYQLLHFNLPVSCLVPKGSHETGVSPSSRLKGLGYGGHLLLSHW